MKDKMVDLRHHLFETIEALRDEQKPMDLDRAKMISDVSKTLIDSARVEIEFLRVLPSLTDNHLEGKSTGFIESEKPLLPTK